MSVDRMKPGPAGNAFEKAPDFTALRNEAYKILEKETQARLEQNPRPTEDEIRMGAFLEEVEPQMRAALVGFSRKGYPTESSGFGGSDRWELQQVDGFFEIDEATEEQLTALGAKVDRQKEEQVGATRTRIEFQPQEAELAKIAERWQQIVDILPVAGEPTYSISAGSNGFRVSYLGEEDAHRILLGTILARDLFPHEDREKMRAWLKEHPQVTS